MTGDDISDPRPYDFFAGAPVPTTTLPAPPAPPVAGAGVATSRRSLTGVTLAAVLLVVAAGIRVEALRHGGTFSWGDLSNSTSTRAFGGTPPLKTTAHPQRLLPAAQPQGSASYAFENVTGGKPIRWDPCQPIHYVVSGAEPFAGANALLVEALREASAASGLKFVADGPTTEPALPERASYQPDRYGTRWAPVLIGWTDQSVVPRLADNVIGLGGAAIAEVHGKPQLVSGIVYFDAPEMALAALRPDGLGIMRSVMLHEIGHLLGLAHVQDPTQVMYPSSNGPDVYGPGDLTGLALAGSGTCSRWT